jgi:anti-anti-sigma factor
MKYKCTNTSQGDLLVKLDGDMDALGCSEIRPQLEHFTNPQTSKNVILDLSEVHFLDSSGIGAIVFLFKRLRVQGRTLEITGVQGQPKELMQLLRIDSAIPVTALMVSSAV